MPVNRKMEPSGTLFLLCGTADVPALTWLPKEDRNALLARVPRTGYVQRIQVTEHYTRPKDMVGVMSMTQNMRLAHLFLTTRKTLNLTQATMAGYLGVTRETVKRVEKGMQYTLAGPVRASLLRLLEHEPDLYGLYCRVDWELSKHNRGGIGY